MVEVFRTNVEHPHQADMLIDQIQMIFTNYIANFDLEDCDRIMRIKCTTGFIKSFSLINLLKDFGFHAEVLPDELLPFQSINSTHELFVGSNQLN